MKTYYEILNIPETASAVDIKHAYRNLSMKYHPDKNKNKSKSECERIITQINNAYDVLGDNELRNNYDESLNFNTINTDLVVHSTQSHNSRNINNSNSDMYQSPNKLRPIVNINCELNIHISKIMTGSIEPTTITRNIYQTQYNTNSELCQTENETIYVPIPKGTDTGEIIIIPKKGNIYETGNMSDVRVSITVINDTPFIRQGLDLIIHKQLTLKESLCGFRMDLEHLTGTIPLSNKRGSIMPHGFKKVIPKYGIPRDEYVGNIIITFNVIFPTELTDDQMDAVDKIF